MYTFLHTGEQFRTVVKILMMDEVKKTITYNFSRHGNINFKKSEDLLMDLGKKNIIWDFRLLAHKRAM